MNDTVITAHADPEGSAPWAMQIVARVDPTDRPSSTELCAAAAVAAVELLDDPRCQPGGEWHPAVQRWLEGRIRKLVRRARPSKFDTATAAAPCVTATAGPATVAAFVPLPVDEVPAPIAKLQVSGLTLDDPHPQRTVVPDRRTLTVAVAPDLELEAHPGKAAAQVAHAAQVAAAEMPSAARALWRDLSHPVDVIWPDSVTFDQFCATAPVTIHDAGFTVVAAGSLTAAAAWDHLT